MARVGDVGKAPPTIGDFLVLGEDIGDQSERPQVRTESFGERLCRRLARRRPRILQEIERWLDRERLRADLETEAGDGLVEQASPRRVTCHRFFVKELFDAILELI